MVSEGPFYVTPDGVALTMRQWLQATSYAYHRGATRPWPDPVAQHVSLREERPVWGILLVVFLALVYLAVNGGCVASMPRGGKGGAAPLVPCSFDEEVHEGERPCWRPSPAAPVMPGDLR